MSHLSGLILGSGLHPEASSNRFQNDTTSHALQTHLVYLMRPHALLHHWVVGHTWSPERICQPERCAPWGRVLEGQYCALQKAGVWGLSTSFLHLPR